MTKGLKLGMLAVAFLAAMTAVVSTGKVEADNDKSNEVRVSINAYNNGKNTCTGTSYIFNFTGSSEVQTGTKTGSIDCILGAMQQKAIQLQLSGDLLLTGTEATDVTIPAENVELSNGTWTKIPSDLGNAGEAGRSTFNTGFGKTLFNKTGNMIGDASGTDIQIRVTVPAGQPDGTYVGTLVLTF